MITRRSFSGGKGFTVWTVSIGYVPDSLQKIELFKTQFAYGQREILLDYMSLDRSNLFLGILQHGFQSTDEPWEAKTPRLPGKFTRSPLWVYSQDRAISLNAMGLKNVSSIGAPWLYLPKVSESQRATGDSDKFIVFPNHTSWSINGPNEHEIRNKIRFWKNISGTNPITICLSWVDYLRPTWQKIASEEGVTTVLAGVGGLEPLWSQHPTRINFLLNLRNMLLQYTHVIFDNFSSAIFYAISLGLSVGYFPQCLSAQEKESRDAIEGEAWITKEMPSIIGNFPEARFLASRNNRMLGLESFRSPEELKARLLYEHGIVPC